VCRRGISFLIRLINTSDLLQRFEEEGKNEKKAAEAKAEAAGMGKDEGPESAIPEDRFVVCRLKEAVMKNPKMKEILTLLRSIINTALPLVPVPPLHEVRNKLLFEFPYAEGVIDFALTDPVGHRTVRLRPLLLVGDPGAAKSRFASRADSVKSSASTCGVPMQAAPMARRSVAPTSGWYSAEPCHQFLAIAQAKHANPLIMIDEIEKAGTRADYGRLWDCLLGFLEPETASRYPDPALQTTLDLSHVSFMATANSVEPLPLSTA
jgi:ATP-dependent Lon protease